MRLFLLPLLLSASAYAAPMRVAVMEFTNAAGADLDGLGKGLQSMVTTDLAQVGSFKLVERQRLQDVEAELKLSRTAEVDKSTAAKIGKLAGASHLVSGAFTVIGEKMRIDLRLFAVETGEIMLAEKIEGEKAAFFELEKDLVKKVIDASGTKLAPKERADVGRIHTADFEAFRKFSQGVAAFDDKKYDQALEALKDAEKRDKDFKLAHVTLSEYEGIINKLRSQATEILTAQDQLDSLNKEKARSVQAQIAARLFNIAAQKGDAARYERLTALHTLILGYSRGSGNGRPQYTDIEEFEDKFALDRTADGMTKSYWAEASALWPKLPVLPSKEFWASPTTMATFDKEFKAAVDILTKKGADFPINRKNALLENVRGGIGEFVQRLQLDGREELKLRAKLYDFGVRLGAEAYWKTEQSERLAKFYREALDLDRSTQIYTSLSAGEKNPWRLKELASEIETNARIAAVLSKAPADKKAQLREFLAAGDLGWRLGFAEKRFLQSGPMPPKLLYEVGRTRNISGDHYVIVGNHPLWTLQSASYLGTGPRADVRHASELYYYHIFNPNATKHEVYDAVVIADGIPRKDLTARFSTTYTASRDFWPSQEVGAGDNAPATPPMPPGHPDLIFVFGIRDVRCDKQKDQSGKRTLNRPMHGYGVVFGADKTSLVEITETERGMFERKKLDYKVKEEQKSGLGKGGDVVVTLDGGNLKVSIGGKTLSFRAPEERNGFYGFAYRGEGFVQIGALAISGRK